MPERGPDDWSGGGGEVAGLHQPGFISGAAGLDRELERARHRYRIGGLGDGGVEQHRVVAEFERFGRVARRAEAGVDHQRGVGQPVAQQF
jgi:hypothetical protein